MGRALMGAIGFLVKVGLLVAVAVLVAVLSLWHTVDESFRAAQVTVPDVRGLTADEATEKLAASDLALLVEARRPHESYEAGLVTYQDPIPGASTRRQRVVKVVISSGHQVAVAPNLVGRSRREATISLRSDHVALGQVLQVSAWVAADTVIAQSPAAGAPLGEDARVDLLVSAGPRRSAWVMPDLRDRSADAAREAVVMAGLRIAQEREQYEPGVPPGLVRAQDPPPGARVFRDGAVTLTISRGLAPPTTGGASAPAPGGPPAPPSPAGPGPSPATAPLRVTP